MTANSQLLTTTPKTTKKSKVSKQLEQERNHRNEMELTWRVINRGVVGGGGGKVQRTSSIDDRWKMDRGRVKIV